MGEPPLPRPKIPPGTSGHRSTHVRGRRGPFSTRWRETCSRQRKGKEKNSSRGVREYSALTTQNHRGLWYLISERLKPLRALGIAAQHVTLVSSRPLSNRQRLFLNRTIVSLVRSSYP